MRFQAVITTALVVVVAVAIPGQANAQNPPAGAIFDLATAHPAAFSASAYTQFTTSFVASATSEYVSFAFREVPAYFSFDDASVTQQGSSTNLLQDPGFESDTAANVGTNFPVGWGRWIQPVDTTAIGVVASGNTGDCASSGPHTGSYFWCDGSVQGYDGLYQQFNGLTVGATYTITFWLTDNSGDPMSNPQIDMLVYAGPALPTGTQTIGTPPAPILVTTPVPGTVWLMLLGIGALGLYLLFRRWNAPRIGG
ncbi:MAG: PEP-CTERM sorting domain-containing protein [Bryobacteraceae bacterium]|jgi:hypothetical protein